MKNIEVNEFINIRPGSLIITCKEIFKNKKHGYRYTLKKLNTFNGKQIDLTEQEKRDLINLSQLDSKQFIEELINIHLKDEQIIEVKEGNNYLLPSRFRQFYEKCVNICTENYEIYFNDLAITKFKNTILKLNDRSKIDSINYVKAKLVEKKVNHMHLSFDEIDELKKCRSAWYADEKELYFQPFSSVFYTVPISNEGDIDLDDLNNILELINYFTEYKGIPKYCDYNDNEMVIYYNNGSLKIVGLNKNQDIHKKIYKKAYELLKR